MSAAAFPHAYPFRFVDTVSQGATSGGERTAPPGPPTSGGERTAPPGFQGRVRIRVTANARAAMGEGWQSPLLYPEAIAQAALLLEGADAEAGRGGYLAGIQELSIERAPRAGETLEISVRLHGRFGAMHRFDGEVHAGEELLARGSVLVRQGESAPQEAQEGTS